MANALVYSQQEVLMKKKVIRAWLRRGMSKESFKYQRPLTLKGNVVEVVNIKHGTITYLELQEDL
jgi:hypothetical protein